VLFITDAATLQKSRWYSKINQLSYIKIHNGDKSKRTKYLAQQQKTINKVKTVKNTNKLNDTSDRRLF